MNIRLTTTGRRTGSPREVPLYGWADGARIVIVGSRGGAATDPAWAHNLRADSHALVKIGRDAGRMIARELDGEERDRAWALVTTEFPLYATYQRRTRRRIPLFALEVDPVG